MTATVQGIHVDWSAVGVILSIAGGALAMAWRLGRLEQKVQELGRRMDRWERSSAIRGGSD